MNTMHNQSTSSLNDRRASRRGALKSLITASVTLAAVLTFFPAGASAADTKSAVHVSAKSGKWVDGPIPGVTMIHLQGDMAKGAHSTFTKFAPGLDNGWHTHTHDVTVVVLEGAYLYKGVDGKLIRVGPGEYITIPGGTKHWSGGDARKGVLMYQHAPASFDMKKADAPKK